MTPDRFESRTVSDLVKEYEEETDRLLEELRSAYEEAGDDEQMVEDIRLAFLLRLVQEPNILEDEENSRFLASKVEPDDFAKLNWEATEEMLEFSEVLYGFRFPNEEITKQVREHVRRLLYQALWRHEKRGEWEELFLLLRIAPTSPAMRDIELTRLHHIAHAYEIRRVRRNRRILYTYLILQAFLVLIVFPFLFTYAENQQIQTLVEETSGVELGDQGYQLISVPDAVYWSIITAASIGYGDITPETVTGKFIAAVLGTLGVITVGVFAGLILDWITPRRLR